MTDPLTDRFSSELLFSEACPAAAKEQVSWLAASGTAVSHSRPRLRLSAFSRTSRNGLPDRLFCLQ